MFVGAAPFDIGHQGQQIIVKDLVLSIRQNLETLKRLIDFRLALQNHTQFAQASAKGISAGMLAQNEPIGIPADILGAHDFIGFAAFEDAVLMDTGFVCKGVGTHYRLVGLHRETRDCRDQPGTGHDLSRVDCKLQVIKVAPRPQRHHDFLQRCIASALAQAIQRALHLSRALGNRRKGIGNRQPQVVMAVNGKNRLVTIGNPFDQTPDERAELLGNVIADGIGNVDGASARLDHGLHDATQEVRFRTPGIFRRKLHIIRILTGMTHGPYGLLHYLVGLQTEFALHMDRRCRDERMDTTTGSGPQRFGRPIDIFTLGTGQRADDTLAHRLGNRTHRSEVIRTGNRKTRLDDIHTQAFQRARDAQLLLTGHRRTRTLFTIPQRRVENHQMGNRGSHVHSPKPAGTRRLTMTRQHQSRTARFLRRRHAA